MEKMLCGKCKADVLIPDISKETKKQTITTFRNLNRLQAAMDLHRAAKVDLGDSKVIIFHLTNEHGRCNRCKNLLTENAEEQVCSKCGSLNLDW